MDGLTLLNRLVSKGKLRHMKALIKLNELRNMGQAAQSMGITQPAMSLLVSDLESLLEVRLFLRHAKGVEPTPIARELIAVAGRIIEAVEDGAEAISSQLHGTRHFVRIAATASAIGNFLSEVLPDFTRAHPEIHVDVDEKTGAALDASFSEHPHDLICCLRKEVLPSGWEFLPCMRDKLTVVCAANSRLAAREGISPEELGRATWLTNHTRTASRRGFEHLRQRHGWSDVPSVSVTSRSVELAIAMITARDLVTVMPRSLVNRRLSEGILQELPFEVAIPHWELGVHWKVDAISPAAELLLRRLRALTLAGEVGGDADARDYPGLPPSKTPIARPDF